MEMKILTPDINTSRQCCKDDRGRKKFGVTEIVAVYDELAVHD